MTSQTAFSLPRRNPDVLTCIANLSNDEVFTPPELANRMLDILSATWAKDHNGANIWADKTIKFLDPCTKSGAFLREITRRLTDGLEEELPDLESRVDHILTQQVFGIGITHLTSLLARRSVYCSKAANGPHSIAKNFSTVAGNIWFERLEHTWGGTKCVFCGAPRKILDREPSRENYAYAFIHTDDIKTRVGELFGGEMQFDVIIGNPPYQMKGGAGGTSDSSIYQLFVEQAKNLEPQYISMVIPSRWFAGGRGLDEFRKDMLSSKNLTRLVDFPVSSEVFPKVKVKGGISYFLWSAKPVEQCEVTIVRGKDEVSEKRKLDEFDIFVRDSRAAAILRKVLAKEEPSVLDILTADTPFGIATNFNDFHGDKRPEDIALHYVQKGKRSIAFIPRDFVKKNVDLIDKWKVLVPKAGSDGGQKIPDSVLGKPWLITPPSVATQTFLAFWVNTKSEAESVESYYRTKFFRYLVSLRKITQDALRPMYQWVPTQSWDREWTDELLYSKYGFKMEEIEYIESVIRSMPRSS